MKLPKTFHCVFLCEHSSELGGPILISELNIKKCRKFFCSLFKKIPGKHLYTSFFLRSIKFLVESSFKLVENGTYDLLSSFFDKNTKMHGANLEATVPIYFVSLKLIFTKFFLFFGLKNHENCMWNFRDFAWFSKSGKKIIWFFELSCMISERHEIYYCTRSQAFWKFFVFFHLRCIFMACYFYYVDFVFVG